LYNQLYEKIICQDIISLKRREIRYKYETTYLFQKIMIKLNVLEIISWMWNN